MVRSSVHRAAIVALYKSGVRPGDIARRLAAPRQTVYDTVRRWRETHELKDRPRSGRPITATTNRIVKAVRDKIRRNPRRSMRKMAKEYGISDRSMRRIVKSKLHLKPYKLRKGQALTTSTIAARFARSKELLKRLEGGRHRLTVFTDEKLFTVEQELNKQNDRVLAANPHAVDRTMQKSAHPKKIMVFGGITYGAKTPLIFIDQGLRINAGVYQRDILGPVCTQWAPSHFGSAHWIFQQDGAPGHRARSTQDWRKTHTPEFIESNKWPPCSPDLNPLDFSVWSVLESKVCSTPHTTVESLKAALQKAWDEMDADYLRATVDAVPKRLKACVRARGGRFE